MDTVLHAIAEPRRREILRLIQERELSSGEIAARFDVTGPAISQHLKVLLTAGLVTQRREGTRRLYRARPEGLAEVRSFLETFWDDSLQRLKAAAEAEERRLAAAPLAFGAVSSSGERREQEAAAIFWKSSRSRS